MEFNSAAYLLINIETMKFTEEINAFAEILWKWRKIYVCNTVKQLTLKFSVI